MEKIFKITIVDELVTYRDTLVQEALDDYLGKICKVEDITEEYQPKQDINGNMINVAVNEKGELYKAKQDTEQYCECGKYVGLRSQYIEENDVKWVCKKCRKPIKPKKRFRLKEHNIDEQMRWGSNDDTRKYLKIGEIYDGVEEIHSYHTKIIIDGKKFNSVCFEEVKPKKKLPKEKRIEKLSVYVYAGKKTILPKDSEIVDKLNELIDVVNERGEK